MGTRTYSRRRVDGTRYLTSAGLARFYRDAGVAALDIFGNPIPDDGTVIAPLPIPAPVAPPAPPIVPTPPATPPTPPATVGGRVAKKLTDGRVTYVRPEDFQQGGELYANLVQGIPLDQAVDVGITPPHVATTDEGMKDLYRIQGMHGKPTIYTSRQAFVNDVESGNVLTHPDGTPIVFIRSNPRPEYMDYFLNNDEHVNGAIPGWFGTGTYLAATMGKNSPLGRPLTAAAQADGSYNFWNDLAWQAAHVIRKYGARWMSHYGGGRRAIDTRFPSIQTTTYPMTVNKNAKTNLQAITDANGNYSKAKYTAWTKSLGKEFKKQFGFTHPNIGIMATALGYDGYMVPYSTGKVAGKSMASTNEFVVLNRAQLNVLRENVTPASIARDFAVPYAQRNGQRMYSWQSAGTYSDKIM